ncbi:MAG TPA: bifunctional aspartate kinase/homoserine dehydrogenase I [Chthoniobacterales bacterium]|nr:bifunctional aspartate kinase/homoserine dehydrogenase I [Chthoniobacterales bacterium]
MRRPIDVYKFGGVAVGSIDAIRTAVSHVSKADRVVVVVSAMNGITDLLIDAGKAALADDDKACQRAVRAFQQRHATLLPELFQNKKQRDELRALIVETAQQMQAMTDSIAVLHEFTSRAHDSLAARGERLLARIFTAFAQQQGLDAFYVDTTSVVFADQKNGSMWPDFAKCERAARKVIVPLIESRKVVVIPGYIGSGPDGEVVTLGRGGSDFVAAIIARSLKARALTLFKEVDGLMTADPKSVPNARLLTELHYREATELAYYGAKVLHPRTIIPLLDRQIPLFVRNSFRDTPATRIAGDVKPGAYPVRALTAVRQQALIAIEGSGMIGVPGIAGRAFTALSEAGHSVSMISQASSEASICFVVPEVEAEHARRALENAFELERTRKLVDRIKAEKKIALIAVVGLGMRGKPGVAARTFSALSGEKVNIVAIAQGSSELNITIAVAEQDATRALLALHAEFQLDKARPLAEITGRESKVTLLGFGKIGQALIKQLVSQDRQLRENLGLDIKVVAVADRSGIKVDEKGFSPVLLQRFAKQKASGARLFRNGSALGIDNLQAMMRRELWILPSHRPILVDVTSEETGPLIQEALEEGFHIVLANKKPLAVPQLQFDLFMSTARERRVSFRYEATAGAGLPVFDTLAKLKDAGDRVETIMGCFSGTLGFLMTALEDGNTFANAVREAWQKGYTEPDPREDLSGRDVARKALILARTLGQKLEFQDIELESLFTSEVDDADPARFVANLTTLNSAFAERVAAARKQKKVLRYVAKIGRGTIRVGIEAVPQSSPMGSLRGTANQVAIYSRRYRTNPLVVTGPGAGAEVTAAGVLNDIVAVTMQERRAKK